MNQLDLQERHAVVTGGASGIGLAIARRMLASGAQITIWDRDQGALTIAQQALTAAYPDARIATLTVNVVAHADVARAANETRAIAPIDILVNSAGIAGPNAKLWDYPLEAWDEVMNVNVNGTFFCCREIVPGMMERNYGRIVNIASIAGKEGNPNASAYSASKAAVIGLTKSLGKELAGTEIRVNCVTPAAVKTAIFDQLTPAHIAFMLEKIPMQRFGTTDEIAAMVAWLCTEDCSFTTGGVFDLSGGRATY